MSAHLHDFRQFLYQVFECESKTRLGRIFETGLFLLILTNVTFAALETIDIFAQYYGGFFWWFEAISVSIFFFFYLLRLWVADLHRGYDKPFGRVRFALRIPMVFDLLVLLPFFLQAFLVFDARWLRILRLVRIFRVLRLGPYSIALDRILTVLKREKEELVAIFGEIQLFSHTVNVVY